MQLRRAVADTKPMKANYYIDDYDWQLLLAATRSSSSTQAVQSNKKKKSVGL